MADDSQWVVEPASPDSVEVRVSVGSEAELTPRLREAIENLAEAIAEETEVGGYLADCNLSCGGTLSCTVLNTGPPPSCPWNFIFTGGSKLA